MTTIIRTRATDTVSRLLADPRQGKGLRHVANGNGITTAGQFVDITHTNTLSSMDRDATRDQRAITPHRVHVPIFEETGVIDDDPEPKASQYYTTSTVVGE